MGSLVGLPESLCGRRSELVVCVHKVINDKIAERLSNATITGRLSTAAVLHFA